MLSLFVFIYFSTLLSEQNQFVTLNKISFCFFSCCFFVFFFLFFSLSNFLYSNDWYLRWISISSAVPWQHLSITNSFRTIYMQHTSIHSWNRITLKVKKKTFLIKLINDSLGMICLTQKYTHSFIHSFICTFIHWKRRKKQNSRKIPFDCSNRNSTTEIFGSFSEILRNRWSMSIKPLLLETTNQIVHSPHKYAISNDIDRFCVI